MERGLGEVWNTWMTGVFVTFVRVVYGWMIYMCLSWWSRSWSDAYGTHLKTLHATDTIEPPYDKTNKLPCAPSEDSDQPGHPPSLITVFTIRMKKAWVLSYSFSAQRRLWSDWANAQADLSLRWAHMPFCWFCHDVAQLCVCVKFPQQYLLPTMQSSSNATKCSWCSASKTGLDESNLITISVKDPFLIPVLHYFGTIQVFPREFNSDKILSN